MSLDPGSSARGGEEGGEGDSEEGGDGGHGGTATGLEGVENGDGDGGNGGVVFCWPGACGAWWVPSGRPADQEGGLL